MVAFTHIVESLLDRVRNGKLAIDEAMLSLLLRCGDYISALIDAIEDGHERDDPDPAARIDLEAGLNGYLGVKDAVHLPATTAPQAEPGEAAVEVEGGGHVDADTWHLSLRFGADVLRNGMDPLSFIRYLTTLGRITYLHTLVDSLPEAERLDPESCYLGFEIDFASDADRKTIDGVFEFVRDESQIQIIPPHSKIAEYIKLIETLSEPPKRLGEILVKGGALTEHELDAILDKQQAQPIPPKPIGAMLVEEKLVPGTVVAAALSKQKPGEEKRTHPR